MGARQQAARGGWQQNGASFLSEAKEAAGPRRAAENRAGPNGRSTENLDQIFIIWALAGLTPFLAIAIVRTVFLPRASFAGRSGRWSFSLYSRFHIKQECQQSVLFPEAPVVLTHAEANVN